MSDDAALEDGPSGITLSSIEIIEPAPGAGFLVVLHGLDSRGGRASVTLPRAFPTLSEADEFVARQYGLADADIRLDHRH